MEREVPKQLPSRAANMGPDWTCLPAELITIISEKATTTNLQYLHLRMVCKPWRRALISNPCHLPCQSPWLLIHQTNAEDHRRLLFYDLSNSKTHQIELPDASGNNILGTYYGWIVLVHYERVSLHNPIIGRSIELPSLDVLPTNLVLAVSKGEGESSVSSLNKHCVRKVVLSCNPSIPGCVVVVWVVSPSNWELGFCRIGDTHWTGLKKRDKDRMLLDFTCGNNSVYVVNSRREVLAYDLTSLAMRMFPSKINYNGVHDCLNLVEGDARSDGPLIVITTEYLWKTSHIYVYEWINNEKRWRRVKNIGKSVLYLSRDNCFQVRLEDQRQNEIYYGVTHSLSREAFRIGINKVNLEIGRVVPHSPSPTEAEQNENESIRYDEEFITNSRGNKLFTCRWVPKNTEPKALVFVCHGYGVECSITMRETFARLTVAGYGVYGMDYYGHGKSSGLQGYIPSFNNLVDDCASFFMSVCERAENRKKERYLMGESMGGAVVLLLHRKHSTFWNGAVLVGPMCKIADEMKPPAVVISILKQLAHLIPTWSIVPTNDVIDLAYKDPQKREEIRKNPYCYKGKPRLKTAAQMLAVSLDLEKNLHQVSLPFLIVHGGDDRVTDPSISRLLYESASSPDKNFNLYPGMWHALTSAETPENMDRVFHDIITWLDARTHATNLRSEMEQKARHDALALK